LWRRRYVTALVLCIAFIATGIVGANVAVDLKLAHIKRISLVESTPATSVANYLVIGSDSRAFVDNSQEARAFGTAASQGGQRSDTMMIVHVDPHRHRNLVVSIRAISWSTSRATAPSASTRRSTTARSA
jgi:anionic cell wall polymer biosynthesis LytR-Cps2A-Psr (LCP) family protein